MSLMVSVSAMSSRGKDMNAMERERLNEEKRRVEIEEQKLQKKKQKIDDELKKLEFQQRFQDLKIEATDAKEVIGKASALCLEARD